MKCKPRISVFGMREAFAHLQRRDEVKRKLIGIVSVTGDKVSLMQHLFSLAYKKLRGKKSTIIEACAMRNC